MKWIGQNIYDYVSRFRNNVHIVGSIYSGAAGVADEEIISNDAGDITLKNIDALDSITEGAIEASIDSLVNLVTIGSAGATTNIAAGDLTMYNAVNDGNPTISLGSSATERLQIMASYESGAQGLDSVKFITKTAGSSGNDGRFIFEVDDVQVCTIRDAGINLPAGKDIRFNNTVILQDDGSGSATLANIDALDAATESTIESAIDTLGNLTSASSLATVGTIGTGVWNGTAIGGNYIAATQPNIDSIGTDGDTLSILSDVVSLANTTASYPQIFLQNQTDDASAPQIIIENKRGGGSTQAGQDDDLLGRIMFSGYNDAGTPESKTYARIEGNIHDATDGEESGQLTLQVVNHDGGMGDGLILTGGSANNEIDVTLGLGASSVVTIPGDIDLAGDVDIDGTLETDALTVGGTNIVTGSLITTLGTVSSGTWQGTAVASGYTKHVLHYPFRGYCLGISSGNFQYPEDQGDPHFPFQLNSDYGDTVIADGSLSDVSTWFRSSGVVMPRACTAIDMVGWATCPGTGEVTISLCKITPDRNSTSAEVPVVVATTTFTALNSNDKLEDFSVGDSGGDGSVTIVTSAIAKGDILMPFVIAPNTKTAYFNFTLEVEG